MKEITIISGKGGTGKTSITAALATAGQEMVLCDCDVDAADLHLILKPEIKESHIFEGAWLAQINPNKCNDCGICTQYCKFDAITLDEGNRHKIDPYQCEGCRLCERVCPSKAISSSRSKNSNWMISETRAGIMLHAHMGPGEENSGKLVSLLRKKSRELAASGNYQYILSDGPPGTGCATIASITGSDAILIVIEPSLTSLHDAERVIQLAQSFDIPIYALINKASINPEMARKISSFLSDNATNYLGNLPFDTRVVEAMVTGKSINEYAPNSEFSMHISTIWNQLTSST